ncbi:MAG: hypothetical protein ACTSU5_07035 [Promethearchaeota archaeon]
MTNRRGGGPLGKLADIFQGGAKVKSSNLRKRLNARIHAIQLSVRKIDSKIRRLELKRDKQREKARTELKADRDPSQFLESVYLIEERIKRFRDSQKRLEHTQQMLEMADIDLDFQAVITESVEDLYYIGTSLNSGEMQDAVEKMLYAQEQIEKIPGISGEAAFRRGDEEQSRKMREWVERETERMRIEAAHENLDEIPSEIPAGRIADLTKELDDIKNAGDDAS